MPMSDQEEIRFYHRLVADLPVKERAYKEMMKNLRGLKGRTRRHARQFLMPWKLMA